MIPNCPLRKAYDTWCAPAAVAAPLHNYDAPGSKRADSDDSSDSDAGTSRTTAIPRHVTVWLPHPTYFHFSLRPVRCAGLAAAGSTLASSLARPVRASRYHASAARRGFFKQEYIFTCIPRATENNGFWYRRNRRHVVDFWLGSVSSTVPE